MLRKVFMLVVAIPFTGAASVLALLAVIVDRTGNGAGQIARAWGWATLKLAGVKVELRGIEHLERGESYAFVSNHASMLDIPVIVASIPFQLRFLTKKELFKIPIFGQAISAAGHIKIDRQNLQAAVESLKKASIRLKKNHSSVLIFAEGTRSLNDEVGKFKKGGIILAIRMAIPIVPISISGSRKLAPKGGKAMKSGKIIITVGKPIPTEGFDISDRNALVQTTRDAVVKNMVPEDAV